MKDFYSNVKCEDSRRILTELNIITTTITDVNISNFFIFSWQDITPRVICRISQVAYFSEAKLHVAKNYDNI
jgi:hypothetical protein